MCLGSKGQKHMEIPTTTTQRWCLPLKPETHSKHGGSVKKWFSDLVSVKNPWEATSGCWRVLEGKCLCSGEHQNLQLCLSLPVMLILDLRLDESNGEAPIWDFPQKLFPLTSQAAQEHGLVYDLVGHGLFNPEAAHFMARYTKDKAIYTYDGMKHNGYSVQDKGATLGTHLYGGDIKIPSGYRTHVVIYHLCGGPNAQMVFYHSQIATACQLHSLTFSSATLDYLPNITFTNQNFVWMKDEDRFWMQNPYSS